MDRPGAPDDDGTQYVGGLPRADLVDRLVTPRWYHPVSGAALAVLVAAFATRTFAVVGMAGVLYTVTLFVLPRAYRRVVGVWVVGASPEGARRVGRLLARTCTATVLVGLLSLASPVLRLLAVVAAVVAYVAVQVLGRRFDEALREGLRHDPEVGFKIEERVPED